MKHILYCCAALPVVWALSAQAEAVHACRDAQGRTVYTSEAGAACAHRESLPKLGSYAGGEYRLNASDSSASAKKARAGKNAQAAKSAAAKTQSAKKTSAEKNNAEKRTARPKQRGHQAAARGVAAVPAVGQQP
ncbi:DUF4124 domain-containing protein [Bergeriella denitrificans]|uniref:Uncharacterized protein n=1 Tax=Bergeriella denitrificans TaxID=494 RepID=A0A378UJ88_BERDE|nr:DUF4124 domain-containing protein [Bergeriella denitrificans]STZ76552.1 Uncharacterised protein [Bergeriella denitrificans]